MQEDAPRYGVAKPAVDAFRDAAGREFIDATTTKVKAAVEQLVRSAQPWKTICDVKHPERPTQVFKLEVEGKVRYAVVREQTVITLLDQSRVDRNLLGSWVEQRTFGELEAEQKPPAPRRMRGMEALLGPAYALTTEQLAATEQHLQEEKKKLPARGVGALFRDDADISGLVRSDVQSPPCSQCDDSDAATIPMWLDGRSQFFCLACADKVPPIPPVRIAEVIELAHGISMSTTAPDPEPAPAREDIVIPVEIPVPMVHALITLGTVEVELLRATHRVMVMRTELATAEKQLAELEARRDAARKDVVDVGERVVIDVSALDAYQ